MSKVARRGRVRVQPYVSAAIGQRLAEFCAAGGVTESAVVEAALRQFLDRSGDATLLLRRLDRLGRAGARTQRDLELLSEAFAVWVRLWFAHTASIPDDAKRAARNNAENRYKQFIEHVAEQFAGGRRLLDDLPCASVASDAELDAIAALSADSPGVL